MKKKKKSIRTIILIVVMVFLIPANLLTLVIYGLLYQHIKSVVLETQKDALRLYASQWESQMDYVEQYVLRTINDSDWNALRGKKGEQEYELAKVQLQKEIQDGTSKSIWNSADAICGYIYHTGEILTVHDNSAVTYEENRKIRLWSSDMQMQAWKFTKIDEENYISMNYGTSIFSLAVFVKPETVVAPWKENSEFEIILAGSGEWDEREEYFAIETPFLKENVEMVLYLPNSYINQVMPIQYVFLLLSILLSFLMIFIMVIILQKYVIYPLKKMEETLVKIKGGENQLRISDCGTTKEMQAFEGEFNSLMDSIYNLEIKNYEMEIENQKAQLINLQLQINPHLLLNTLNTIYGLSEIEEYQSIQSFTLNLVKYFRYSLKRTDKLVTLRQELDFVKCYVEVQQVRYPGSFYVVYDVEDELLDERIPPLLIENFVENSIKHSLGQKMTEVLVIIKKNEKHLGISICDNGNGIEESVLKILKSGKPYEKNGETHVGIFNCLRRLRLFYGENTKFSITSTVGGGTQVWMEIPCIMEEEKDEFANDR